MARRRIFPPLWLLGVAGLLVAASYNRETLLKAYTERLGLPPEVHQALLKKLPTPPSLPTFEAPAVPLAQIGDHPLPATGTSSRPALPVRTEKDEAWERFFQPQDDCAVWQSERHMVECQNRVIRAKRDFERRWAAGEFAKPRP